MVSVDWPFPLFFPYLLSLLLASEVSPNNISERSGAGCTLGGLLMGWASSGALEEDGKASLAHRLLSGFEGVLWSGISLDWQINEGFISTLLLMASPCCDCRDSAKTVVETSLR